MFDVMKTMFSKVNGGLTGWRTMIVVWLGFIAAGADWVSKLAHAVLDAIGTLPTEGTVGALVVAGFASIKALVTDVWPRLKGQMPRPPTTN